jgi:hypothetical protein
MYNWRQEATRLGSIDLMLTSFASEESIAASERSIETLGNSHATLRVAWLNIPWLDA